MYIFKYIHTHAVHCPCIFLVYPVHSILAFSNLEGPVLALLVRKNLTFFIWAVSSPLIFQGSFKIKHDAVFLGDF